MIRNSLLICNCAGLALPFSLRFSCLLSSVILINFRIFSLLGVTNETAANRIQALLAAIDDEIGEVDEPMPCNCGKFRRPTICAYCKKLADEMQLKRKANET
jgi:hypothetical protein